MKPYRARSTARLIAFVAVLVIALLAIVARLAQVQLVQGETFASAARENQIQLIPISAPRGLIVDRTGVVMVRSRPSFVCALIPSEVVNVNDTLHALATVLHIDQAKLADRLYHHLGVNYQNFDQVQTYEPNGPIILASDLSPAQTAQLAESESLIPGVDLEEQPVRNYPLGTTGAQVFGYVGAITEDEYRERQHQGYSPNDVIGKDGLEQVYDQWLRGKVGGQQIEVNSAGVLVRRLKPVDPIPGNTLVTTIDARLQRIVDKNLRAELSLRAKQLGSRVAGAVVVLDPYTGGVLAMASYPTYDPNDFATPISARKFAHYLNDPLQPLYNRAIGAASPTGSTFKMVTGSGAISSGVIGKDQVLYDSGSWNCHGVVFSDIVSGGLGTTDFVKALAASSDGYFYQLGYRLGHERLRYYALQYGLGSRLGIDLPGEYPGNWPTEEWTERTFGKGYHLEPSDVCQLAIGQGAMQATPLQIADVLATVLNGGTLYRPHVVSAIRSPRGKILETFDNEVIRRVNVTREALHEVKAGMDQVTSPIGTGYGLALPGVPLGGKSGTAQTGVGGAGRNTTWFVMYAPAPHPKLAMAVYMEKTGGYGASVAGIVAQHIVADYFHVKLAPIGP
ncbi:MAG: penicillin-binding protein 2 [Candidatus Lustribacter sp.]